MLIKIVHLKRSGLTVGNLIPLDRSTVYGNDFSHLPKSRAKYITDSVTSAIKEFSLDLKKRLKTDSELIAAYEQLYTQCVNSKETIHFGCWCMDELAPMPHDHDCHTTVVRQIIYNRFKRENKL